MAQNNHDWQSLVELSGLLVSEPVLREQFPEGPQPLNRWLSHKFRTEYERWRSVEDKHQKDADSVDRAQKRWLDFVLRTLLDYDNDLRTQIDLPPQLKISLSEFAQTLTPDRFVVDVQGNPQVLVYFAEGQLDKPEQKTGRWKASPFTKLDRLLRDAKVQLGILTNGQDWRLVYAAPGLPTSYITWIANGWNDERLTLQSFVMLLRNPGKLLEMASESQSRQADVTDKLGNQVLNALSIFVRQLDRADVAATGALLNNLSSDDIYEMALFVMMRLVFIFYAEENGLLPHGEFFYDDAYGLTNLWNKLDREHRTDEANFAQREDAWPRLLATFRLIHAGCSHPDLSMAAYGGALFDPERFPMLEDPRLRITNLAIWRILRRLTTAESSDGRQRVSYRALQVEQLGYVYENLLGFTIKEAADMMMTPEGTMEAYPVSRFVEVLEIDGEEGIYNYYKGINSLHWTETRKHAKAVAERAEKSSEIEWIFEPITEGDYINPGQRYVAFQMGTRKRGGIFYTPPQLTSFLVEQALKPQVYDDPDNEQGIRDPRHILSLTVCDPAMGSGAFLVQAVRYLGNRLVESWTAATAQQEAVLVMPYAQVEREASENLGPIPTDENEAKAWAYRLVAERCIYGVDLNRLASELAKLSIWLVSLAKDKPFTFLDHRLRHGNSLIGASFFKEATVQWKGKDRDPLTGERIKREEKVRQLEFIPDEALQAYKDADKDYKTATSSRIKGNQKAQLAIAQGQMGIFGNFSVEEVLKRLIQRKAQLEQPTQNADDYTNKSALLRQVLGQGDYPLLKEIADLWCAVWFWPRDLAQHGMPPTTQEYHDVVQMILNIAPKDIFGEINLATQKERIEQIRSTVQQIVKQEHFFHWELEFPTIFTRNNPGFDAVVGNPPWETLTPNSQEFFEVYDPQFRRYNKQEALRISEQLIHNNSDISQVVVK